MIKIKDQPQAPKSTGRMALRIPKNEEKKNRSRGEQPSAWGGKRGVRGVITSCVEKGPGKENLSLQKMGER